MKRLNWLLTLLFPPLISWGATKTSTKTVTVGQTFELNPVSWSGISSGKGVLSGSAKFPTTDGLAVSSANHSVTIVAAKNSHNGITGSYTTYTVTALKTGTYVITGSATSCKSYSSKMESIYWTTYSVTERYSGSFSCTLNVVDVTSISIPSNISLTIGENYTFTPTIYQAGATTTLTWNSSNASVASVNSNGTLTANKVGTTIITCTAHNGVSASCTVTVNPILASNISLNISSVELVTGEKQQLAATVSPNNTTNRAVTWSSSNPEIAVVDDNGLVTAKSSGQCMITVATADGSNKVATCAVNVLSDVLYIDNAVGVPSGTLVLPIQLKNLSAITGAQFELQLPEGVSVARDKANNLIATMSDRATDQDIMCSQITNGNYQLVIFSGTSSPLSGNEGAAAYVTLNIANNVAEGSYIIRLKEIELTKSNSEAIHHKDIETTLTITAATIGDTNGDSKVTVTDAVGIVNYILGRTPSVFISKAADVNNDGSITITDAVQVINHILNK